MANKPSQFFIIPDPLLPQGKITVYSATSEGGLTAGEAVPQTTNQGAARPILTGTPLTDVDFTARVQGSGGIDQAGTWSFLSGSESDPTAEKWQGQDDQRYMRSPHGGAPSGTDLRYSSALFLPQTGEEFIYWREAGDTTISYRVRGVDQHPQGWATTATITGISGGEFDIIRLPDGTALMATASGRDIDLYMSADGITWTVKSRNILERFLEARSENSINGLQMAISGDWIRILWQTVDNLSAPYLQSVVSSDRGASWKGGLESSTITPGSVSGYTLDIYPFTIVGIDDDAGSFLLIVRDASTTYYANVYTATGGAPWLEDADLQMQAATGYTFKRMRAQRGHSHVWILVMVEDTGNLDELELYRVNPADPFSSSGWEDLGTVSGFYGTVHYHPGYHTMRWMGSYMALFGALIDDSASSTTAGEPFYWQSGAWDMIPLGERWTVDNFDATALPSAPHQPSGRFASIEWAAWMGTPAGPGGHTSANTPWTVNRVNSTSNWNSWRLKLASTATIGDFWYAQYQDLSPSQSWCVSGYTSATLAGSCVEWEMQGHEGSSSARDGWAVRLRSQDYTGAGPATQAIDLSFRITPLTIHIIDNAAGASLAALPAPDGGSFDTDFHQFRVAFRPNPKAGTYVEGCRFNVKYRRIGQTAWSTSPTYIPNMYSGNTQQWIRFGHLDPLIVGISRISHWRYCRVLGTPNDLSQMQWSYPEDVRGRLMSAVPVWTLSGQHTHWMGGSAFEADQYDAYAGHHYPMENALIASPSLRWEGSSVAAGTSRTDALIFTPQDSNARFMHNAISLFGLRTRQTTVQYDDTTAFSSPSNVGVLDTLLWGPLRVEGAIGNVLQFNSGQSGAPPLGYGASNSARKVYARITAVGAGGSAAAIGRTYLAEQHLLTSSILLSAAEDLSAYTLPGASVILFGDRGTLIYSSPGAVTKRYLRLTFNNEEVHGGAHTLEAMVPGVSYKPETEIQWAHRDSEAGNVTNIRTRGAVSWAYEEGPPQRVITGRIVGDVEGDREIMRNLIRAIGYEVSPIVMHMDGDSAGGLLDAERMVYGRLTSGMDMSNPAWKLQTIGGAERWQAVGDLVITLEETV